MYRNGQFLCIIIYWQNFWQNDTFQRLKIGDKIHLRGKKSIFGWLKTSRNSNLMYFGQISEKNFAIFFYPGGIIMGYPQGTLKLEFPKSPGWSGIISPKVHLGQIWAQSAYWKYLSGTLWQPEGNLFLFTEAFCIRCPYCPYFWTNVLICPYFWQMSLFVLIFWQKSL